MDIGELHNDLREIEASIEARGLRAEARAYVNCFGDDLSISVEASEPRDEKGSWSHSKDFAGSADDAYDLLVKARAWVCALPSEEDRAIELMIQKLTKIAGELPAGHSEIARAAWREIHSMLVAKAEQLAKNGLPSPNRITKLTA